MAMPRRAANRLLSIEMAGGCQNDAAMAASENAAATPQTQGRSPASIVARATSRNETGSITAQWRWRRSAT